jgi:hypothetical protein
MASNANTVALILDPGKGFINLCHLATVPRGDTVKESYSPFVGVVIQPLGITFDLMPLSRKMSESFLDLHTPAPQAGCVRGLNIALHRSSLLRLEKNSVKTIIKNHLHVG